LIGTPLIDERLETRDDGKEIQEKGNEKMTSSNEVVPTPATALSADSKNWAVISHLSAFVMLIGIPAIVGPLVAWLVKREDPYVDFHGKEAVNFNISFLIYTAISALLIIVVVGLILLPAVLLTWFVLVIVAAVKASAGDYYKYPLTIRFIS
jgi:uncharacterized Tic20 family protein